MNEKSQANTDQPQLEAANSPLEPADAPFEERVCEECGATPEEGHTEGCSFFADDEEEG